MGSSFIDYRANGFWCRDGSAELWLYLLSEEADRVADRPAWLAEASADWRTQATLGCQGAVSASLDKHLGIDPERVETVVALSERVRLRLHGWAPAIPMETVNGWGTGGSGTQYCRNVDTVWMLRFADAFLRLLNGKLRADPYATTVY
ncbi:hypothetical protein BJY24_000997 [Nocardia transvalensis]|uniref:Uncharacterized protein n=1 Tax=Nocardia transvalensis TaxID=37333 RepID=A0A7W9PA21_9NOCA|nr:hypothetical protein [Nocardia transvalensis]MBB5912130.1 hypothetical protein [Nocardia transvalensis]